MIEESLDPQPAPPTLTHPEVRRETLYRAAVGPKNQDYYVTRFLRFDASGRAGASWNWTATFFTFCWMLYRKMWGAAALYFALPYFLMAISLYVVSVTTSVDRALAIGIVEIVYIVASVTVLPMYANAIYYWHCNRLVTRALKSTKDPQQQIADLTKRGGTGAAIFMVVAALSFVSLGGLSAIAIPAYQDYATRPLIARAEAEGREAAAAVARYYNANHKVPASMTEAGFVAKPSTAVSAYGVDQNGIVAVTIAAGPAKGRKLLLVPIVDDGGNIHWHCLSRQIPKRQLPPECRK